MADQVVITFRDGDKKTFGQGGMGPVRGSGSGSVSVLVDGPYTVVTDEYGSREFFPSEKIDHISERNPGRRSF